MANIRLSELPTMHVYFTKLIESYRNNMIYTKNIDENNTPPRRHSFSSKDNKGSYSTGLNDQEAETFDRLLSSIQKMIKENSQDKNVALIQKIIVDLINNPYENESEKLEDYIAKNIIQA